VLSLPVLSQVPSTEREIRPGHGLQYQRTVLRTVKAVRDTKIPLQKNAITALIGPSGCGKTTVLRCMNRMNDLIRGFRFEGYVNYRGRDIYGPSVDPVPSAATSGLCSSSRTLRHQRL